MAKGKRPKDDSQSSLEDFFSSSETDESDEQVSASEEEENPESTESLGEEVDDEEEPEEEEETLEELRVGERDIKDDLPPSYLLSIDYAGAQRKAFARLYNPADRRVYFWFDNTGHQPYCYTDFPVQVAEQKIGSHGGYVRSESIELTDLLRDETVTMT
ncbi:MAG: hypothetical protein ACFFC0_09065, partial [Promethearchaeota archaeon]